MTSLFWKIFVLTIFCSEKTVFFFNYKYFKLLFEMKTNKFLFIFSTIFYWKSNGRSRTLRTNLKLLFRNGIKFRVSIDYNIGQHLNTFIELLDLISFFFIFIEALKSQYQPRRFMCGRSRK